MKRVHDGAIGDIVAIQETYLTGTLWHRAAPARLDRNGIPDAQLVLLHLALRRPQRRAARPQPRQGRCGPCTTSRRCGPGASAAGRSAPTRSTATSTTTTPWCYEYANGVRVYSYCRQQAGCYNDVSDIFIGTKGRANILKHQHRGRRTHVAATRARSRSMYDVEHEELFAAIRSGKPINNGHYMARSTMLAILGRMVTYTGQAITWDEAINSQQICSPPASTPWTPTPPTAARQGRQVPGRHARHDEVRVDIP